MKELIIKKTPNTPSVNFNPDTGVMKLEGRSIPENPGDFYDPIIEWLEEYFKKPVETTNFEMSLEYVNSGSSKYLLGIFRILKKSMMKANYVILTGIMRRMMRPSSVWASITGIR